MLAKCASCKNKRSNEQCPNSSLQGIRFCGIHSKIKNPRLWVDVNDVKSKVCLISKIWRGYSIRKRLSLAGNGVMKRTECNNDEELTLLEPIKTVYPLDYFGFEEKGKVYGFDICSILDIANRNLIPRNPYTREPLSIETRKRMRQIYGFRMRNKLSLFHEGNKIIGPDNILNNRWMQICQIVEENGFYDINPNLFLGLNKSQLYIFLNIILNDMKTWAAEHANKVSKRFIYCFWIRNILHKHASAQSVQEYSFYVSTILLTILYDSVEPYNICFIIMSALHRL
jgi:hypothetical protein